MTSFFILPKSIFVSPVCLSWYFFHYLLGKILWCNTSGPYTSTIRNIDYFIGCDILHCYRVLLNICYHVFCPNVDPIFLKMIFCIFLYLSMAKSCRCKVHFYGRINLFGSSTSPVDKPRCHPLMIKSSGKTSQIKFLGVKVKL